MQATTVVSVAPLMARIASGDQDAVFELWDRFEPAFVRAVRTLLASYGRADLLADPDEVHALAMSALFVVVDRAGSWRADGGALPWRWCHRAIRERVSREIGHRRAVGSPDVVLDAVAVDATGTRAPGDGGEPAAAEAADVDFVRLAERHETVALLLAAAREVGSARDVEVHLDYRLQRCCGDPSPAVTVAAMHALSPANVRQIDHRMRRRLGALIAADPRYSALATVPWLSPADAETCHR